jgi:hypothetical protein
MTHQRLLSQLLGIVIVLSINSVLQPLFSQIVLDEDFQTAGTLPGNLPPGWSTNNVTLFDGTSGPAFFVHNAGTANAGAYWPVPEVGSNNRFAGANDDAPPCDCMMDEVYLQTPVMNFSGISNPAVTFNIYHDGNFGGGDALLQASTDGGFSWNQVNYPNDVDGLFTISEGLWQTLVITLFEFSGLTDVRLRFTWSDAGSWASGFAVDNVVVGGLLPVSLTVERAIAADWLAPNFGENYWDYTKIPLSQVAPVKATGVVYNSGLNTLNNASLNFEVLNGTASQGIWNVPVPALPSLTRDTLSYISPYTPSATGVYSVKVSGNAGATEQNTSDNVATSSFEVTECTYARDDGSAQAFFQLESGDFAGNLFDIYQDQTFSSIQVALGGGSTVGGIVVAAVYQLMGFDAVTDDPIFEYVQGTQTVEADVLDEDLNSAGGSHFICLPFESPVTLPAGGVYLAAVAGTDVLRIPVSGANDVPASWVYSDADGTYGWTQGVFMVRLQGLCGDACAIAFPGCTSPSACNYNPNVTIDDGSCFFVGDACSDGNSSTINDIIQSNCQCAGTILNPGCTSALACNYDLFATVDDGSCLFIGSPCNDFNSSTINDVVQNKCQCQGSVIDPGCSGFSVNNSTGNPTCAGLSNGFISVNAAGTSAPFTYNWSNGSTGSAINNVGSGNYSVTITDALGCSETLNFNLSAPQALNALVSSIPVNCYGAATGSASVSVTGGTAPYAYAWTTSPIQNTAQISNVPAGSYTVNITDANGCVFSSGTTISEPGVPLAVTATATPAACSQNDGTASASVSGNTGIVQYVWSNGQTGAIAANLAAGNYTVTVTSGGCSAQTTVSVNNTNAPVINHVSNSPQCFGDNTGSISTIITGGTQPYQYLWSNGGSGTSQTGLAAGNYTFVVIDNVGCQASIAVTLTQPNPINIALSATPTSCSGTPQGAVNATVSGGSQPYLYSWSNGSGGTSINNLSAGVYTLTITDAAGCSEAATSEVVNPDGIIAFAVPYDVNCIGGSDGSMEIFVTEGTPPYSYEWNTGETGTPYITNLEEGEYSCVVTDAAGCTYTASASINSPQGNLPEILGMSIVDPFTLQTYSVAAISGATLTWAVTGGNILSGQGSNFIQVQWSDDAVAAVVLLIFYPNGCQASIELIVQIGTNVNEWITQPTWTIFPNPASEMLQVEVMNTLEKMPFVISDALGKTVLNGLLHPGVNGMDLDGLASGVYTLTVTASQNNRQMRRFIKE